LLSKQQSADRQKNNLRSSKLGYGGIIFIKIRRYSGGRVLLPWRITVINIILNCYVARVVYRIILTVYSVVFTGGRNSQFNYLYKK